MHGHKNITFQVRVVETLKIDISRKVHVVFENLTVYEVITKNKLQPDAPWIIKRNITERRCDMHHE